MENDSDKDGSVDNPAEPESQDTGYKPVKGRVAIEVQGDPIQEGTKADVIAVLNFGSRAEAMTMVPVMHELYERGHYEESRAIAAKLTKQFYLREGLKLLMESDLELGYKSFCAALIDYMNYLRLSPKKSKNFPVDKKYLLDFFDLARSKGMFVPVPVDAIPPEYLDRSAKDMMVAMSEFKNTLHLRGEMLSALYLILQGE